jgi:hypothetical protein
MVARIAAAGIKPGAVGASGAIAGGSAEGARADAVVAGVTGTIGDEAMTDAGV